MGVLFLFDVDPIATLSVDAGKTESFSFGYHTAIPADATKVIAVNASLTDYPSVETAAAVFDIPAGKRLGYSSGDALYTFNSFSDIHIDEEHFGDTPAYWWEYSENHWAQALSYATHFIHCRNPEAQSGQSFLLHVSYFFVASLTYRTYILLSSDDTVINIPRPSIVPDSGNRQACNALPGSVGI